jgi:hypothetical protein
MSWLIERTDEGLPMWLSITIGADYAHPGAGWTREKPEALQFSREQDAKAFLKLYVGPHDRPFCTARLG